MELNEVIDSFVEESLEGLDLMESRLLSMQPDSLDPETVNEIFRAAHSIKGGGGIFGFKEISDFMHGSETLLDQIRSGQQAASNELIDLLLESVDCAREMFNAVRRKKAYDVQRIDNLTGRLQSQIVGLSPEPASSTPAPGGHGRRELWHIEFKPHPGMLAKANDPLRMFKELAGLGSLRVESNIDELPDLDILDPAECYIEWQAQLEADTTEDVIREAFAWVLEECDLTIEPIIAHEAPDAASGKAQTSTAAQASTKTANRTAGATESIRVSTDKVDHLINLVGELVITQSMLNQFDGEISDQGIQHFQDGLAQLMRNTQELQESVLQIRMLPIHFCFKRFPRLVHDISNQLGKKVELQLSGEDTELDKTVLERINDPLVHLVRNSLDHGFESTDERLKAGKPETGTLTLSAFHESGNIIIEVSDDGAGLNTDRIREKAADAGLIDNTDPLSNQQINNLIFHPGLSTSAEISELSGRGVGMDVVKRNINELGGDVWLESQHGKGTTVSIRLPLTLAILEGQLLRVGQEIYVMPLNSIIETLQINPERVNTLPGNSQLYRLREYNVPIIRLSEVFGVPPRSKSLEDGLLIIVDSERQRYGIWVDDLLDQQQVVIKSLKTNFTNIEGVSGATILGDGTVALILDVTGIITLTNTRRKSTRLAVA